MKQNKETGLAGVSAMIIFIAFILVSSIAGGVILDTAGLLQQKASSTGEEATAKISNTLDIGTTTGLISQKRNPGGEDFDYSSASPANLSDASKITQLQLDLLKTPGAGQIDTRDITVKVIRDSGTNTLKFNTSNPDEFVRKSADPVPDRLNATAGAGAEDEDGVNFSVKPVDDSDDSYPIITDRTDRFQVRLNFTGPRDSAFEPIRSGDDVLLRVTTASGSVSTKKLSIPVTLPQETGAAIDL